MIEPEHRGQLVLRVWGSFVLALLLVALLGATYEAVFGDGISPAVLFGGVILIGSLYAVPLLILAAVAAFFFTHRIATHPALWGGAATIIVTILCYFLLPHGFWIAASLVSAAATAILCWWLAHRPLGEV